MANVTVAHVNDSHSMNEPAQIRSAAIRNATRIGMLVGACVALLWTADILSFARRPIETEELGLYQLFAIGYCIFCVVMFLAFVAVGALVGWALGIALVHFRDRASRRANTPEENGS